MVIIGSPSYCSSSLRIERRSYSGIDHNFKRLGIPKTPSLSPSITVASPDRRSLEEGFGRDCEFTLPLGHVFMLMPTVAVELMGKRLGGVCWRFILASTSFTNSGLITTKLTPEKRTRKEHRKR